LPGNDDSSSPTTTPPTTQRKRNPDADGNTFSKRRDEPHNGSPKPKRDGANPDQIASPEQDGEP
jgi:hypothetical protein